MSACVWTQRGSFSETVAALVDGAHTGIGRQPEPGLGAHDSTPHQAFLVRFVIPDYAIGHCCSSIYKVRVSTKPRGVWICVHSWARLSRKAGIPDACAAQQCVGADANSACHAAQSVRKRYAVEQGPRSWPGTESEAGHDSDASIDRPSKQGWIRHWEGSASLGRREPSGGIGSIVYAGTIRHSEVVLYPTRIQFVALSAPVP